VFTEILSIILFLLLLLTAPTQDSALQAIPMGLSYLALISLIWLQKKVFLLAYLKILLFFGSAIFLFGWDQISSYQSIKASLAVFLYLFALFVFHKGKTDEILLLLPFFIPFLLISFTLDLDLAFTGTALAMAALILFFPPLLILCWRCKPIPDPNLRERLEKIAEKARFSHGGFMVWNIPGLTAAIVGVVPTFRYILLTNSLIFRLTPEALEAVLAHEIGHSQHHHLLFAPFILSGCLIPLLAVDQPSALFFIFYTVFSLLYFRYVFGFYSRLFEREADLHGLKCAVPLKAMREALDQVGIASGFTHRNPSWHHYSLYERIQFLESVEANPALEKEHHRKVSFWKWIYIGSMIL
jgi:Zn-dependent protease with chaperone function